MGLKTSRLLHHAHKETQGHHRHHSAEEYNEGEEHHQHQQQPTNKDAVSTVTTHKDEQQHHEEHQKEEHNKDEAEHHDDHHKHKGHLRRWSIASHLPLAQVRIEKIADEVDKLPITMKISDPISDFLDIIMKNDILSVPLFEKSTCVGFFGIEEFILHLGYHWKEKRFRDQRHSHLPLKELYDYSLGSILAIHRSHSSCLRLFPEDLAREAITLFAAGAQRIAVFNTHYMSKNLISKVLSQSALLMYAHQHPSSLGEVGNEPISEVGTPWSRAPKVRADAPLICAILLFTEKLGWPIAVVGDIEEDDKELSSPKSTRHISSKLDNLEKDHCLRHRADEEEEDERVRLEIIEEVHKRRQAQHGADVTTREDYQPLDKAEEEKEMANRIHSTHSHHPTSVLFDEQLNALVGSDSDLMSELSSSDEINSLPMIGHLSPIDFAKFNTYIHNIAAKHNMKVVSDPSTKDDETFDPMTGLSVFAYLKEVRETQKRPMNHIVSVPHNATILDAVNKMVKEDVHQVYVLPEVIETKQPEGEEAEKQAKKQRPPNPIAIVSMTSMCHKFYSEDTRKD